MSIVKVTESLFPQHVSENLEKETYVVSKEEVVMFLETIIEGTSDFLREVKSKHRNAVVFRDLKANFIVAAVLEYNVNEEEDGQDNYNYFWTFNEDDITSDPDTKVYEANSNQIQTMIMMRVKERSYVMPAELVLYLEGKVLVGLLDLTNSLSGNVTDTEPVSIEHDGFFKITIALEDGQIFKSFIPDGPIKTLIKDDASTM